MARKRFFKFFDGVIALNMEQYEAVKKYNGNAVIIHSSSLLEGKKPSKKSLEMFRSKIGINGNRAAYSWGWEIEAALRAAFCRGQKNKDNGKSRRKTASVLLFKC